MYRFFSVTVVVLFARLEHLHGLQRVLTASEGHVAKLVVKVFVFVFRMVGPIPSQFINVTAFLMSS